MSELTTMAGLASASADVLPGHVLSTFTVPDIAEAEKEIQQFYLRTVATAAASAAPGVGQAMLQESQNQLAFGTFTHGANTYWRAYFNAQLVGELLCLALRARQPQMTVAAARLLVTPDNLQAIQQAVMKCAGYKPGPAPNVPTAESGKTSADNTKNSSDSPGENSTDSSSSAG